MGSTGHVGRGGERNLIVPMITYCNLRSIGEKMVPHNRDIFFYQHLFADFGREKKPTSVNNDNSRTGETQMMFLILLGKNNLTGACSSFLNNLEMFWPKGSPRPSIRI